MTHPHLIATATDAAVASTLQVVARNGANATVSAAKTLTTAYSYVLERFETQPNASPWTEAAINASEFGMDSSGVYA